MKQFKIHDLEILSGVKAQTIRVWELRYAVFSPGRSATNVRYYSVDDLKRLLDISLLLQEGCRISNLFQCSEEQLASKIRGLASETAARRRAINALIVAMYTSDIEEFESVLDTSVSRAGIDVTVCEVILPFLGKTGILSYDDKTGDVHFVVTAVRKKIIHAIESAHPRVLHRTKALLFLPEKEHYDLLLLYAAYVLKSRGFRVLYLGTNISNKTLEEVDAAQRPDFFVTYLPEQPECRLKSVLSHLTLQGPDKKLYVLTSHPDKIVRCEDTLAFVPYTDFAEVFPDFITQPV
jgi:DNA-binding transcriptional MerR regulator